MGEEQEYVKPYLPLAGKNVVLGVTGSIAAFKAADLASKLVQSGAQVDVVMTSGASEFVGPTTFEALTHRPVTVGLFESNSDLNIDHVALALRADVMVVAPATANTLAKLAIGLADDPLGATALATSAPLIVAPAMDAHMWANRATAHNVETLKSRGVRFAGPVEGRLASGLVGSGRMVEPAEIVEHVRSALATNGDYSGRAVVVSAGGTREPLDPVRYIGNRSSGKMGYAIAAAARDRGAAVTLVAGPGALPDPVDVDVRKVQTALEMRDSIMSAARSADLLVMAAAVSDFRPEYYSDQKIKKDTAAAHAVELQRNPDIIAEAHGPRLVKIAFAAETGDHVEKARPKLEQKGAAFVVANDVSEAGSGFESDTNRVSFVGPGPEVEHLPMMDKLAVAHAVLDRALPLLIRATGGRYD